MSEIRTRLQGGTPFFPNMLNNGKVEVCLKEDVDKVLAEKDKQLRHQKFKRCLAMENWCMTEYLHSKCLDFTNTEQWYWRRWHIRWRNLAKKFKEGV